MQRQKQNIGAVIENRLCAIAMMKIDIQNGNPVQSPVAHMLRRRRSVVDEAVTAILVARGMVSRWTTQ